MADILDESCDLANELNESGTAKPTVKLP